jgi:hypothetical protein
MASVTDALGNKFVQSDSGDWEYEGIGPLKVKLVSERPSAILTANIGRPFIRQMDSAASSRKSESF